MTTNKSLKRTVRERMSKTGERYTAARRQVLARNEPAIAPEPMHGPTNRTWPEWVRVLDEWGAVDRTHSDIARWLAEQHGVPPWWTQDITVRYEKHIGRRVLGQRGQSFSATATRTMSVTPHVALAAWMDAQQRVRWLPDVQLKLRPNRVDVVKRFDVDDDNGRLVVSFDAKPNGRTTVAIEHEKLRDGDAAKRWTTFWRSRLTELKAALEGTGSPRATD